MDLSLPNILAGMLIIAFIQYVKYSIAYFVTYLEGGRKKGEMSFSYSIEVGYYKHLRHEHRNTLTVILLAIIIYIAFR